MCKTFNLHVADPLLIGLVFAIFPKTFAFMPELTRIGLTLP